ncbi:MAG: PD-(D/E)XK nuclease family protein [Thermoplasmata archaeon]|nr:PD-(D/E)XK nuclease family protein [Thermoplasmata archaeon]
MRTLRACKRQYWYRYYGKRFIARPQRPLLLDLLRLSSLALEAGSAVHLTLEELIKDLQLTGRVADEGKALSIAERKFEVMVRNVRLFEDRYGSGVSDADLQRNLDKVREAVRGYFRTSWPGLLASVPPEGRPLWVVDPEGFGEFRFEGLKVFAKPDLIFRGGDGAWWVVDWKTGRPNDDDLDQVMCYMFFAHEVFGIPLEGMTGAVEYLSLHDQPAVTVKGGEVDPVRLRTRIFEELAEVESLCADVEQNVPLPIEAFPRSATWRNCGWCNFREICGPELGPGPKGLMGYDEDAP